MKLSSFDYHLPPTLIAQSPIDPRDHAKLMLINRTTGSITHHHIYDLPQLIPKSYFIVANNTKVFPARLLGRKSTGGKVEILLTKPLGHSRYLCISKPGLKLGDVVKFEGSDLVGIVHLTVTSAGQTKPTSYERTIKFNLEESTLRTTLSQIGSMPTPPYIKKMLGNNAEYQTLYAKYGFSAAAPTAGLHFTNSLLATIKQKYSWNEITLNVGLGTFLPVKEDDISHHHMHSEPYVINSSTAQNINTLKQSQKLLSIGTTTMRALESNATYNPRGYKSLVFQEVTPGSYSTDIFIYPPYRFSITDALLTNFHLPGSTLLMLVSAFCTYPNSKEHFTNFENSLLGRAYTEAIAHKYRFFSFGDAMLII